jgi:hypothetical protein
MHERDVREPPCIRKNTLIALASLPEHVTAARRQLVEQLPEARLRIVLQYIATHMGIIPEHKTAMCPSSRSAAGLLLGRGPARYRISPALSRIE